MLFNLDDFFEGVTDEECNDTIDYKISQLLIDTLDAMSRVSGESLYVINYLSRGFLYVSQNPLFLNGYLREDVLKMGYSFYEKNLPQEDIDMLLEINKKGFAFFYQQPIEDRLKFTISYDFRLLQKNKSTTMINHKLTPILLTPKGNIWLALCSVMLSTEKESGNVYINKSGVLHRLRYSFEGKRWRSTKVVSLSKIENVILKLSAQGLSNKQIAETIYLNINTIKFHKKNIYQKLNVKNITEAIVFAHNNYII